MIMIHSLEINFGFKSKHLRELYCNKILFRFTVYPSGMSKLEFVTQGSITIETNRETKELLCELRKDYKACCVKIHYRDVNHLDPSDLDYFYKLDTPLSDDTYVNIYEDGIFIQAKERCYGDNGGVPDSVKAHIISMCKEDVIEFFKYEG